MEDKEQYALSNTPVFDEDKFIGLLEVPIKDILSGEFEAAREKDIKKFLSAYNALFNRGK